MIQQQPIPYEQIHEERFKISENWLKTITAERVLEVGHPDAFSKRLAGLFPSVKNTDFDLRFGKHWTDYRDQFDLVVCMELLEHINEPIISRSTIDEVAAFRETGVLNAVVGMYTVLRRGGKLFLSTPNGSSLENIRRALNGYTPIQYPLHVREYGPNDVVRILKAAGFTIDNIECKACYSKFKTTEEAAELLYLRNHLKSRYPSVLWGETTFIIASKP